MSAPSITHDQWVERALAAALEQGHSVAVEDPAVLDLIAEVFAHAGTTNRQTATAVQQH